MGGVSAGDKPTSSFFLRVGVPRKLTDYSSGAELVQLTIATKKVLGRRLQFADLGTPVSEPAVIDADASAALAGPMRNKTSRSSQYIAARLAMVRQAFEDRQIELVEVGKEGHKADGYTRPLVEDAFRSFAAGNLGW